jgi:hypothetical protein
MACGRVSCGCNAHAGTMAHLSKDVADFEDLQLGTPLLVLRLVDRVGYDDLVKRTGVDAINGITAQDAVRDERIHLGSALLLQQLGGTCDGVGGVGQIVDEDGGAVCDVTDQHHGRILPVVDLSGAALLVDQRKGHAKGVGDGGGSLGASSVGADNDGLLVVGDVELDIFAQQVAPVEVVDRDVEETLVLRV